MLPSFTGFNRVSDRPVVQVSIEYVFTGFYRVSNRNERVEPSFTGFYRVSGHLWVHPVT